MQILGIAHIFEWPAPIRAGQCFFHGNRPCWTLTALHHRIKKADVVERPKAFGHVGLLFNKPPGKDGLFFT